ncbi:MAG: hypothetical protein DVB31_10050 [Verrucomicrobia bacterium]|nr:MAG: hypothetical protein DVB31_10050 [Verrucomicrobiota bacterium]
MPGVPTPSHSASFGSPAATRPAGGFRQSAEGASFSGSTASTGSAGWPWVSDGGGVRVRWGKGRRFQTKGKRTMKTTGTWLTMAGLALAGMGTAQAGGLAITAFDATGKLAFGEVPGAESYRVEWSTNLDAASWSSTAPGIASVSPSGTGTVTVTVTVTVGLPHPACFYRVVAIVTNDPPVGLADTFDQSAGDWLVVDYPFRSHRPNPATVPLPFDGTYGVPAGSVRIGDLFGETGIAAPARYVGNKSAFYGGSLAYDIFIRYSDNAVYPGVFLNGGSKSVYYDAPSPPVGVWQHRTVPLSEPGWKDTATGQPATAVVFKEVLGNLVGLYIYTEWHSGADDTNVDNISLKAP